MKIINHASKSEIGQLLLLKYLDKSKEGDRYPSYFHFIYGINPEECVKQFWSENLIAYATSDVSLKKYTLAQLKAIADTYGLEKTGKKTVLIDRIINNVSVSDLEREIKQKYIVITDKGIQLINNSNIDFEYNNRYSHFYIDNVESLVKSVLKNDYDCLIEGRFVEHHAKYMIKASNDFLSEKPFKHYDKTVKAVIIVCFFKGIKSEAAVLSIKYYLGIDIEQKDIHYAIRFLQSDSRLHEAENVFDRYTIKTLNDDKVCPHCKSLENKVFDLKKAVIGVNYPPFKDCTCEQSCRCYAEHDLKYNN